MDEHYISGLFNGIASIQSVKLIRDKLKGTPVGYGFVEFPNHEIAKNVFMSLNGTPIPGTQRSFKLNLILCDVEMTSSVSRFSDAAAETLQPETSQ